MPAASVRISPHGYFTVFLLATFFAAFLFYLEMDIAGIALWATSWIVLPFFALNDRITFDGKRLTRTGLLPRAWAWFNHSRRRLKISDIEQVETSSVRALRRGGNVMYRHRTVFRGKGLTMCVASGGEDYRRIIHSILPLLPENVLDGRSIELRDHLADPKETLRKAESSRIPSADLLEGTFRRFAREDRVADMNQEVDPQHAGELQDLGNELRVSGHLARALEAFRRALHLSPRDARLLFDFARCLYSFAGVERDPRLERKAMAVLRLSQQRAGSDGELLARLGEWYFQIGEFGRAGNVFQRVADRIGENFRAARGLAEIALREGKIAHVIHHFAAAKRVAETPALRRWAGLEADYFAHLNDDEEYMEMEIGRVNLLETVEVSKRTSLRIAVLAIPAVLIGVLFEDNLIANIGWAVSTVSLLIWVGLGTFAHVLAQRIPYHLVETDD
jgi:tetratricopeptide (TPR) repeat protein